MQIQNVPITSVKPYEKNPRFNDDAVDAVAKSIKEFGWQQPIVVDSEMVVIAGHTRLKAAERLGLTEVPVIIADNLTPEQVKAYRIADNKTGEIAEWNYDLLPFEIKDLQDANFDLSLLGFDSDELDKLLNGDTDKQVATGETEPDAVPDAPEVAPALPCRVSSSLCPMLQEFSSGNSSFALWLLFGPWKHQDGEQRQSAS